jgi:hypothetical protein
MKDGDRYIQDAPVMAGCCLCAVFSQCLGTREAVALGTLIQVRGLARLRPRARGAHDVVWSSRAEDLAKRESNLFKRQI